MIPCEVKAWWSAFVRKTDLQGYQHLPEENRAKTISSDHWFMQINNPLFEFVKGAKF